MKKIRAQTINKIGDENIIYKIDYKISEKTWADGKKEKVGLDPSDTIYFGLKDGQFICIRPSGTEPKLKIYILIFADNAENSVKKADALLEKIQEIIK
jgi:phosphoglucomutase